MIRGISFLQHSTTCITLQEKSVAEVDTQNQKNQKSENNSPYGVVQTT